MSYLTTQNTLAAAAAVVETLRKIKQTCKVQRILVVVFCSHALILESSSSRGVQQQVICQKFYSMNKM